jgi:topoisomerase-4 subunit A
VYYDGEKDKYYVKRFLIETKSDKKISFISEHEKSRLEVVTTAYQPKVNIVFNKRLKETKNLPDKEVNLADFIDIKGMKSQGNQLTNLAIKEVILTHPIKGDEPWPDEIEEQEQEEENIEDNNIEEGPVEMEWEIKPKKNKQGPIKDADDDDVQPKLFDI